MGKTPVVLAVCFMFLFVGTVVAELTPDNIQRIVREENQRIIDHQEESKKSIIDDTYALANTLMDDFLKIISDTEKKIIIISAMSLAGIIIFMEGILGFFRIRREQNTLLIIKADIDRLRMLIESGQAIKNINKKVGRPPKESKEEYEIPPPPAYVKKSFWQERKERKMQKKQSKLEQKARESGLVLLTPEMAEKINSLEGKK